jgi:excisionase family DNA binding protein
VSASVPTSEEFAALAARVTELEARLAADELTTWPWLTVKQAAAYLGLTEHATRKFIDRHHTDKHQHVPGGRILVHRDDLDTALSDGRRPR